jgi:hypothetical protein
MLLGISCPFCGGLRATSALLEGDVSSFVNHNALLAVAYPLLFAYWIFLLLQKRRHGFNALTSTTVKRSLLIGIIVVVGGFGVLRNMFPYLGSGIN